jgi:hypothetical protein
MFVSVFVFCLLVFVFKTNTLANNSKHIHFDHGILPILSSGFLFLFFCFGSQTKKLNKNDRFPHFWGCEGGERKKMMSLSDVRH